MVRREVYILSTGDIITGKTAGAQRVMKIAKSLTEVGIEVFLCVFSNIKSDKIETVVLTPGISVLMSRDVRIPRRSHLGIFLRSVTGYILDRNSNSVIYLYPTTFVLKDFIYLIYFRYLKKLKFFCEINELRTAIALTPAPAENMLIHIRNSMKSLVEYFKYRINEVQVPFYDGIVVISTALEKHFMGKARRMIRIPILCDSDSIDDRKLPLLDDDSPFKICFAGYIKYEKEGFNILYESLSIIKQKRDIKLYLYGKLEDRDKVLLERLANEFGLRDDIFYMGNIEPEKLPHEFGKYNLLILPRPINKRTQYGFSTKLSEYLVSGIPVLVTDVSDNSIYIKDGFNGYIVPPGSSSAMADKIHNIIRDYNRKAAEVVKNAHSSVKERLDYRLYSKTFAGFFWPHDEEQ